MNARDYLTLLRESKILIGTCLVLCLLAAVGATALMPKQYASQVTFYVVANGGARTEAAASDNYQGAQLSAGRVKSYIELMTSRRVAADAARALGGNTTTDEVLREVEASSVADTVIITLVATDPSPTRAVQMASAVSDSFLKLVGPLETAPGPDQQPAVGAEVIEPPTVPGGPVSPSPAINITVGLLLGLLLGVGLAIARRALSDSIRTAEDLRDAVEEPVLGVVPQDRNAPQHPISLFHAVGTGRMTDARTEAYRRIRTNLELAGDDRNRRVLLIASALSGDGRTLTACNLAAALSAVGSRVVLVEGDLRRPVVAKYLNIDPGPGLSDVLAGSTTLEAAMQRSGRAGFDVLVSGGASPVANEVVSSRRAGDLIETLRSSYEFVIIDSPPILPVADAVSLGANADGAVLVVQAGRTRRRQLSSAMDSLEAVSIPVIGAILSRAPKNRADSYQYTPAAARSAPPAGKVVQTAADWDAAPDGDPGTDRDAALVTTERAAPEPAPERPGGSAVDAAPHHSAVAEKKINMPSSRSTAGGRPVPTPARGSSRVEQPGVRDTDAGARKR